MNYRFYINSSGGQLGWLFWRNSVVHSSLPPLFRASRFVDGLMGRTLWGFTRLLHAPTEIEKELWLSKLTQEWQPSDTEWPPYGDE